MLRILNSLWSNWKKYLCVAVCKPNEITLTTTEPNKTNKANKPKSSKPKYSVKKGRVTKPIKIEKKETNRYTIESLNINDTSID